ncbi:MAG: beta-propeller domain-containing protein [Peptococcaceae bacterium]|nr:beta-propeller domain-containing protein [Peptococcaceae bacterium]
MNNFKRVFLIIPVFVAVILAGQYFYPRQSVAEELKKFTSKQQLAEYIKANRQLMQYGYGRLSGPAAEADNRADVNVQEAAPLEKGTASAAPDKSADAYSTTNVQVEGVDEADILKNDGRYLYLASGNRVHILDAYPAEKAGLLSSTSFDGHPLGMFLNGDRLMVIGSAFSAPGIQVKVYDITDRKNPAEVRTLAWEGGCVSSRMIGNYVFLVLHMPVGFEADDVKLPRFTENNRAREVQPGEIHYFDYPDYSYRYTMILAVNMADDSQQSAYRAFLTGTSQNVYASLENLYLTGIKAPDMNDFVSKFVDGLASLVTGEAAEKLRVIGKSAESPDQKMFQAEQVLEDYAGRLDYAAAAALEERIDQLRQKFYRDLEKERNKTVIYKFSIKDNSIEYNCRGEVGGHLLNQFSMDEQGGYLRVATTSEGFLLNGTRSTRNNVYVMDDGLHVVGKLEGLAISERIYAARFMGSRVYLVTFRQIDPLFVIDLKDPQNPKVLGQLKIPGYSDYLHPYDENHLIGVGKDVSPASDPVPLPVPVPGAEGTRTLPEIIPPEPVRPQGVKIALFDVSNPARPVEISKYVVDQAYSDTEVSRNHKAFLFSRERNLLALPVSCRESFPVYEGKALIPNFRQWQGMYVFNISPAEGIRLKGKIDHRAAVDPQGYKTGEPVRRAAYIKDVFYTISDGAVKMSRIDNLKGINLISLPRDSNYRDIVPMVKTIDLQAIPEKAVE